MTTPSAGGRVWLITGASSGLGRALTLAALARGDTVVGAARRADAVAAVAATSAHRDALMPVELDVTDANAAAGVVERVVDRYGRIDVLVNNAGRALIGAAEETTDAELRDLMDVHFFGPAALVRAVLPHMRTRGSGAVVQVSSVGGQLAMAGVSAYCATKWALEGYSEGLAAEVAPFGIRVLIVEPGAFRTGLHGAAMQESAELPAYAGVIGPARAAQRDMAGVEPGDPAKAATVILDALSADRPPLRLVLGTDAVDGIRAHLDAVRAELADWEAVSRSTDIAHDATTDP